MGSWTRGILAFCGVTGLGYGLLKLTTPSPDRLYEKLSDAQKAEVDLKKKALEENWGHVAEFIKENAKSDRPAWDVRVPEHVQKSLDKINESYKRPS